MPIATGVLITMIVVTIWASQHSPDWAERGGEGAGETGNDGAPAIALSGDDGTGLDHAEPQAIPTPIRKRRRKPPCPKSARSSPSHHRRPRSSSPPRPRSSRRPCRKSSRPPRSTRPGHGSTKTGWRFAKPAISMAPSAISVRRRGRTRTTLSFAYELGYTLEKSGDRAGAIAAHRRAIALKPDHGYANYNLGYLLSRSGAPAATEHLQRAAELLPQNVHAHFAAAQALDLEGDLSAAERAYQRVLDLESGPAIRAYARIRLQRLHEGRQETAP